MKFGVLVFPGSNCDQDTYHVISEMARQPVTCLWHDSADLQGCDAILVPGGFAYGDYLRTGAIAHFSPVMQSVKKFAAEGGPVLGICNGFQIMVEAGMLPGALLRNAQLHFACKDVHLRVETAQSLFTTGYAAGQIVRFPVAHGEGNYFADDATLNELEQNGQIAFRYVQPDGSMSAAANPNGSARNIAGIYNRGKTVLGMMPHPERLSDPAQGGTDGKAMFKGLVEALS